MSILFTVCDTEENINRAIEELTEKCANSPTTLFIDTEVADYKSKTKARVALIQILARSESNKNETAMLLDVLNFSSCLMTFIHKIMMNDAITKVFHNKSYDLQYLGGNLSKNVECTLEMAREIPYHLLPVTNLKLTTLVEHFVTKNETEQKEHLLYTDKEEMQSSDWAARPISDQQMTYAAKDVYALEYIYDKLKPLVEQSANVGNADEINQISSKIQEMSSNFKSLESEMNYLQEKLKQLMVEHNVEETQSHKLSTGTRTVSHVPLYELANAIVKKQAKVESPIMLTDKLLKELNKNGIELADLSGVTVTHQTTYRLTTKN
jgi:ribonuclease D